MTTEKIKSILEGLGYKLTDNGSDWRSSAVYRGGDNPLSLQIYKDTGAWFDYVQGGEKFRSFKSLVELTLQTNDSNEVNKVLGGYDFDLPKSPTPKDRPKLNVEKTYPESILSNLLPHYLFYEKKGVSEETLSFFKGGLATQGAMYQRFVFPIYNSFSQIHGFSGRDMSSEPSSSRPKWKHMGKKSTWIYPYYIPSKGRSPIECAIEDTGMVFLVESIGDLLNLYEHGIHNVLVSFGTSISPALICFLVSLPINKVVISFNNDFGKSKNRGEIGALKTYLKLLNYFDRDNIHVHLPPKNDFGEMSSSDFDSWSLSINSLDTDHSLTNYEKRIKDLIKCKDIPASLYKKKYFQ